VRSAGKEPRNRFDCSPSHKTRANTGAKSKTFFRRAFARRGPSAPPLQFRGIGTPRWQLQSIEYIREGTPSPGGVAGDPNRAAGRGRPLKGSQPRLNGPRERTTRSPGARSYRFRFIILSVESGQMTGTISASRDASADLNRYLRYGRRDCTRTFNLTRVSPPSPTRLEVTQAQLGKLPYRKPTS
jgi:hypothetical protein